MFVDEIWIRLYREPEPAYEAFMVFCNLGPTRTRTEVLQQYLALGKEGRSLPSYLRDFQTFSELTHEWAWDERAAAFDRHEVRLRQMREAEEQRQRERMERERIDNLGYTYPGVRRRRKAV